MTLLDSLAQAGVDTEATLHRFGDQFRLLERFVLMFPNDPTYAALAAAVETCQYDQIEQCAHTLKGTAANLGFQVLSDRCAAMVFALRSDHTGEIGVLMVEITRVYDEIMELISHIGQEED